MVQHGAKNLFSIHPSIIVVWYRWLTLISQPVTALDSIIHVPSPVILRHVSQGCVNASLRRDGVGARRKQLGDTGRLEAGFTQTHGGTQTRSTGSHYYGIVRVIHDGVVPNEDRSASGKGASGHGRHGTAREVACQSQQHGGVVFVTL